ncbi:MAG: PstS family phosphate ABC transporter substrate-binding protein [Rahnella inusitata]|jgi:phosphate transport system substrate-binding protein
MNKTHMKYIFKSILYVFFILPNLSFALCIIFFYLSIIAAKLLKITHTDSINIFQWICIILTFYLYGNRWAKKNTSNQFFYLRYGLFIFATFYSLMALIYLVFNGGGSLADINHTLAFYMYIQFILSNIFLNIIAEPWFFLILPSVTYLAFFLGMVRGEYKYNKKTSAPFARTIIGCSLAVLLSILFLQKAIHNRKFVTEHAEVTLSDRIEERDYRPFTSNKKITPIHAPATVKFEENWPHVDGATALYPLYASAVEALYKDLNDRTVNAYISMSTTPNAYKALNKGTADLIFVAAPSDKQIELAKQTGKELHLTPIAREAFVFITHIDNPITNLSTAQIRNIYSGKTNYWNEVGGSKHRIIPFQRDDDSGSQTTMQKNVMKGLPMRTPLKSERVKFMSGLISRVADYQNTQNALGYSFRYYTTIMQHNEKLRLLSIDGIAPTVENIRNGKYPLTVDVNIVTSGTPSENSQKMINWFLSPQGKKLIEDVGYIAIQ